MHPKHRSAQCREMLTQICDYIDGELDSTLCAEIERHLGNCDDCRVLVDTTRKTITLFQRHNQIELPAGARERLWQALEENGCVSPKKT